MINNILAVVVTFNRLELLKRCYEALRQQSYDKFDILIVNNGSTDGTYEWIESLPPTVLRIHQANLGGAGGFYIGQKYGYDKGYEWIWMMDDDGVPDSRQLEELISVCLKNDLLLAGPLVVNIDCPELLSVDGSAANQFGDTEFTEALTCPFNGTFINRKVIEKIGYIKAEMFIWGDEVEYRARARKNGFQIYTIIPAIHYHPPMKIVLSRAIPFLRWVVKVKPTHFSHYFYRNLGYNSYNYASKKVCIFDILTYTVFFSRTLQFKELFKFWKYYLKGIRNDFE